MKVTLRDGSIRRSFPFVEPSQWNKQNCEFLAGLPTGLGAPFDRVFVKRVHGYPVVGHNLLLRAAGRPLPASPRFLGYAKGQRQTHLYFFQNLGFKTLEEQLNNSAVVCPEIVSGIVRNAADLFKAITSLGYIYIDFCAKNIMLDRKSNSVSFIDIDSSWPQALLRSKKPKAAQGQIAFWGLWNESLSKVLPVRIENAQKSILLSFAAVWSRAVVLKRGGKKDDILSALTLVRNPSFDRQRPLWEALEAANKQKFLEYFQLRGVKAVRVYAQWQEAFNALRRGRELAWQEIVSAADNLLAAIGERDTHKPKPRGKKVYPIVKRRSLKNGVSQWSIISEAEAEDVLGIMSGNYSNFLKRLWQNNYSKFN